MPTSQQHVAETIGVPVARRHIFLCCEQTTPKCCEKERGMAAWEYLKRRLTQLRSRRDAIRRALGDYMPEPAWWYEVEGGVCYWLNLPAPARADEVLIESRKRGVVFAPKHLFAVNPSPNDALRVGFTDLAEDKARAGIRVLGQVVRKMLAGGPQPPLALEGAYARVHV